MDRNEIALIAVLFVIGGVGYTVLSPNFETTSETVDPFEDPDSSDLETQFVAESADVWSGPGTDFYVEDELPPGEEVIVNKESKTEQWIGLQSEFSGVEGYVQHQNLTTRDTFKREAKAADRSWSFETGIAKEETIDQPSKAQVKQRIYVSGKVTEDGLQNFLRHRYARLSVRNGFEYYEHPTNIYVYVHETKSEAQSGGAGWLAALMKGKSDSSPDIQVQPNVITAHNEEPSERWGLSENARKKLWRNYVEMENKAMAKAKSRYPANGDRRMSYEDKLIAKYKSQLAQRYGVRETIIDSVSLEGIIEKWNLP